jgi:phosphatidylethanolamine-binding protein (PEBP) family uncharacterized protein
MVTAMTSRAWRIEGVVFGLLFAGLAGGGCSSNGGESGTGGAAAGSGGRSGTGSGGSTTAGSGGAATGSGGSATGSGGSATGSGGSATGSGGSATGSGGAGTGTGGAGSGGRGTGGAGSGGSGAGTGGAGSGGRGAGTGGAAAGTGGAGGASAFTITSTAFANQPGCAANMAAACATFPVNYTSFGTNISPPMSWTGAPAGVQSFAILMQDLSNGMAHWVLWNIPASVTMLAENVDKTDATPPVPAGSQQCSIGPGDGYFGSGQCGNVYEYVVYALSIPTFTPTMPTNQTQVRMQLQNPANILGSASMRARSAAPECGTAAAP